MRRINESVRQVLSEAVPELKDPRIGFVTVTGVETTPDLQQARVFVSVFGASASRPRRSRAWPPRTAFSRRGSRASSGSSGPRS